MQVTHVDTADTHAILGGGRAGKYKLESVGQMMLMLSDGIYSDKIRAVVREVVSNAHDAHVIAGKLSEPITIELTEDEFVVSDRGPGIPHDEIEDRYCTYGGSTKAASVEETGGFGLGCKAPFAYTTDFTIENQHDGVKAIYLASRGTIESDGDPDWRQMVSTGANSTGLTVRVPIKSPSDYYQFKRDIASVVEEGAINATLNGTKIETFAYSTGGFTIIPKKGERLGNIAVKMGCVLYPLDTAALYESCSDGSVNRQKEILEMEGMAVNLMQHDYRLVLTPPNGSVVPVPSREALAYTERGVEVLRDHAQRVGGKLGEISTNAGNGYLRKQVKAYIEQEKVPLSDSMSLRMYPQMFFEDHGFTPVSAFAFLRLVKLSQSTNWRSSSEAAAAAVTARPEGTKHYRRIGSRSGRWDRFSLEDARAAARNRLHMRLITKCDVEHATRVMKSSYGSIAERGSVRHKWGPFFKSIVLGRTVKDIEHHVRATRGLFVTIKTGDITAEQLAEVKKYAERYKLPISEAPSTAPISTKKRAKGYVDLKTVTRREGFQVDPSLEKPDYFLFVSRDIGHIRDNWGDFMDVLTACSAYENVAVARSESQVKRLQKLGAKNVMEEIYKEAKKLVRVKSCVVGYFFHNGLGDYSYRDHPSDLVNELCRSSPELISLFSPHRVTDVEKMKRFLVVTEALSSYQYCSAWQSEIDRLFDEPRMSIEIKDMITAKVKALKIKRPNAGEISEEWECLSLLSSSQTRFFASRNPKAVRSLLLNLKKIYQKGLKDA